MKLQVHILFTGRTVSNSTQTPCRLMSVSLQTCQLTISVTNISEAFSVAPNIKYWLRRKLFSKIYKMKNEKIQVKILRSDIFIIISTQTFCSLHLFDLSSRTPKGSFNIEFKLQNVSVAASCLKRLAPFCLIYFCSNRPVCMNQMNGGDVVQEVVRVSVYHERH